MIRFFFALVAAIWVGQASSAATYNVDMVLDQNMTDLSTNSPMQGAMTVKGTIQTDGTLGWLKSRNVVAWKFTLTVAGVMSHTISSAPQTGEHSASHWLGKVWADTSALVSWNSFSFGEMSRNRDWIGDFSRLTTSNIFTSGLIQISHQAGYTATMGGPGAVVMATRPNGPVTPAPVPLPAPILMLGAALVGLFGMRRFQRGEMVAA